MDAKVKRPLWQRLVKWLAIAALVIVVWLYIMGRIAGNASAADVVYFGDPVVNTGIANTNWTSNVTTYQQAYFVGVATGRYPGSMLVYDQSYEEPVAHTASAGCRRFKKITNRHRFENHAGAWMFTIYMRTSWCYDGRRVQKIYPAENWARQADWAFNAGQKLKGPYKRAANCYTYNGISSHNCLWKQEWHDVLSFPVLRLGDVSPRYHCLGTRVYGDGHHRRSFKC